MYNPFEQMNKFLIYSALLILAILAGSNFIHAKSQQTSNESPHSLLKEWKVKELLPGGRFDAIAYVENETLVMGSRGKNPGYIFISKDLGLSWEQIGKVTEDEITCLDNGGAGLVYMLTGKSNFYRSEDYGLTWKWLSKLSNNENKEGYTLTYGIMVTDHGTVLVSDTESSGGHIYRSTDRGNSWQDLGVISPRALYRFERTGNGILVNGWHGSMYRSQDDGKTWHETQKIAGSPLYATEYLGAHVTLQASEDGHIYRSQNYGETWQDLGKISEAADDFVKLGTGAILLTTYKEGKNLYISSDYGKTWENIGPLNTGAKDDWFDHVIYVDLEDKVVMVGGSNKGFAIRAEINRDELYAEVNKNAGKNKIPDELTQDISRQVTGKLIDFKEINEPEDILMHRNFAFIPCRDGNNVSIIDVNNPENPKLAFSLRHPELLDAFSVSIEGNFMYAVSMSNQKLIIADISNPYQPKVVKTLQIGGEGSYNPLYDSYHTRLRKVFVKDGIAYVTHSNEARLYLVDVHEPTNPKILSYLDTKDGGFAVFVEGNYAYLGGCFPGASVIVVDISDKKAPSIVKSIYDDQNMQCTCDFKIHENYLYATGYTNSTYLVFDISKPEEIKLSTIFKHPHMKGPGRLAIHGHTAYVINSSNDSVAAIDISQPEKPKLQYFFTDRLIQKTYGVATDDKYLYLAGRDAKSFVVVEL
ncbi:MAG: hypothetical protein ACFCUU_19575 [Cyclobacteriaceae bacterium]